MNGRRLSVGVLAVVAALAMGGYYAGSADISYVTARVERGNLLRTMTATGQVNAVVTVTVGSQQSGQISELLVDFNNEVKKDQPIARLDPRTFEAKVREAEAALTVARANVAIQHAALEKAEIDLEKAGTQKDVAEARVENAGVIAENAKRDFRRKQVLVDRATIAPAAAEDAATTFKSTAALRRAAVAEQEVAESAVTAAEASRKMAEATLQHAQATVNEQLAALEQAQIDLARTVIRAPIDGVVIDRKVDPGQTVAATLESPTLFTIAQDLHEMEVHAKVDEADIGRIQLRQAASISVDAYPDRIFHGTVAQIRKASEVTENVVTYTVVLTVQNTDLALLPGMTAVVRIIVDSMSNVLQIPNDALRFRPSEEATTGALNTVAATSQEPNTAVVWALSSEGTPLSVRVKLGRSNDHMTQVLDGSLRPGQALIVGTAPPRRGFSIFGISWTS
jgi:HlyD family secretion protein